MKSVLAVERGVDFRPPPMLTSPKQLLDLPAHFNVKKAAFCVKNRYQKHSARNFFLRQLLALPAKKRVLLIAPNTVVPKQRRVPWQRTQVLKNAS